MITNINAPAGMFHNELKRMVLDYERACGSSKQAIWKVVCLSGKEYQIYQISHLNPSLIRFGAIDDDGQQIEILMNVASVQLTVKFVAINAGEEKRIIGFNSDLPTNPSVTG